MVSRKRGLREALDASDRCWDTAGFLMCPQGDLSVLLAAAHDLTMGRPALQAERQLALLGDADAPSAAASAMTPPVSATPAQSPTRDRVSVDMRGLGDQLRRQAALHQTTPAAMVRRAVRQMLGGPITQASTAALVRRAGRTRVVKVTLRLDATQAATLAARARAADLAQGDFVAELLDGIAPPPVSPHYETAVAALRASTDRLAALSTDLNAFVRLLGRASVAELELYRGSVTSLTKEVQQHLAAAAALIAELRRTRRPRR